jgi:glycosyltransferase involved in cell wall biosynthesis
MIPRVVHFVFGLREQRQPFHFAHYLAVASARRVVQPDAIYFHHKHLPWGPWWDRTAPFVTPVEVELVPEVLGADYSTGLVPPAYRYAHHADFIRLDALIEHGGMYADIDTVFVHPVPAELYAAPFVIGTEDPIRDERTGELRPSMCNALLMAEPNAPFARAWRDQMAGALNGTWSNHSGFLPLSLSQQMPDQVRVEPAPTFFPFLGDPNGLHQLFMERHDIADATVSVHLWAHLWWERTRRDVSWAHAGWCTPSAVRRARSTFAELARPYLPEAYDAGAPTTGATPTPHDEPTSRWIYLSLDEANGYGVAADRCRAALEASGQEVDWAPLLPTVGGPLPYAVPDVLDPFGGPWAQPADQVVVAHLVPEYFPPLRQRSGEDFLVGHTVWDTDRIPDHWVPCLNTVDLLVVPSRFSAAAMESSPVSSPVAVVPHVVSPVRTVASPLWDGIPADRYVFYTIAEWSERKAVHHTVEAYLRAFDGDDPVLLVVKTSPRDLRVRLPGGGGVAAVGSTARSLAQIMSRHRNPPAVTLVTRPLTDDDILALHGRGDCFVSLCRSEGWGLGAFDAAAFSNPVVTTGFGGHLDFLAGSPYLVDFDLVPVHDPVGYPSYAPDQHWAEPDVDHGAALLRHVLAQRADAADGAASLADDIRWRFRPDAVAATFRQAVAGGITARRRAHNRVAPDA